MAKKKQRDIEPLLAEETVESIAAVLSFLLALIFTLAWFGKAGKVGAWILVGFTFLLGKAFFLLPLVLVLAGLALLFSLKEKVLGSSFLGAFMLLLSGLGLAEILFGVRTGGLVGEFTAKPFVYLFDTLASVVIFGTLILVSFLIIFNASLRRTWQRHGAVLKEKTGVEPLIATPPPPVKEEIVAAAEALSAGVSAQQKKEEIKKDLSAELLKKL